MCKTEQEVGSRLEALHRGDERAYRKVIAELVPASRRIARAFEFGEPLDSIVEALGAERSSARGMAEPAAIRSAQVQVLHAITELRQALDRWT